MPNLIFNFINSLDDFIWGYLGFPVIILLGLLLSYKSNFVQIRKFPDVVKIFLSFLMPPKDEAAENQKGVKPLQAFFACIGGCVGVGNIVSICTAAQIGGPGALFWIWVTAILGMLVKYAEVYLGMKFRVPSANGYNGGPQYFLQKVFKKPYIPSLAALLLCIYGVEIYQFSVVTHSVSYNFGINQYAATFILLALVLYASVGGVSRVGNISSMIIPVFVVMYMGMGGWVLYQNLDILPSVFYDVFYYAFTPHGALGGFVGSALLMTISQGIRRGCYTGDVGIGYASVIHSETSVQKPERQASLVIFDVFVDTFMICTTSVVIILTTGVWAQPMDASLLVQTALAQYFPYMNYFMPFFLFLLGYSTINAYYIVGTKCAEFLSPKRGRLIFNIYGSISLVLFSFVGSVQAQSIMAITGGLLLLINSYGIFKLRNEISFDFSQKEEAIDFQASEERSAPTT